MSKTGGAGHSKRRRGDYAGAGDGGEGLNELLGQLESYLLRHPEASLDDSTRDVCISVMKQLHTRLVPASANRLKPEHHVITETDATVEDAYLTATASSIFARQEIVDVIASFLNITKDGQGPHLSRDGSSFRLLNKTSCATYTRTVKALRYYIDKDQPGKNCRFFFSFPSFHSIRLRGGGKGAVRSIDAVIDTIGALGPSCVMRSFWVDGQVLGMSSMRKLMIACRSPTFSSLEELRFRWARLDLPAMREMCKAWQPKGKKGSSKGSEDRFLPKLRVFSIPNNDKLGDGLIELFEAWEEGLAPTLEVLDLRLCGLRDRGLTKVVDLLARGIFPSLQVLLLGTDETLWSHNSAQCGFIEALVDAFETGAGLELREIVLKNFPVSSRAVEKLCRVRSGGGLAHLQFIDGDVDRDCVAAAFGAAYKPTYSPPGVFTNGHM